MQNLIPEKETLKGKYKNPKLKSKRCEIVKSNNRIIQKVKICKRSEIVNPIIELLKKFKSSNYAKDVKYKENIHLRIIYVNIRRKAISSRPLKAPLRTLNHALYCRLSCSMARRRSFLFFLLA